MKKNKKVQLDKVSGGSLTCTSIDDCNVRPTSLKEKNKQKYIDSLND